MGELFKGCCCFFRCHKSYMINLFHFQELDTTKNEILLTGDNLLRKKAINDMVSVKGILFIMDYLVENKIITKQIASFKLSELIILNTRLPKNECERRLNDWNSS